MKKVVLLAGIVGGAVCLALAVLWLRADDPRYTVQEVVALGRFSAYDDVIAQAAARHRVDPALVKAVIWRESRFHPDKTGTRGERGLMQITEAAASDWAAAEAMETFVPTDLFDPKVNIEAGTWYLRRAMDRWADRDDPEPFALAEFNAGRTRVHRWMRDSGRAAEAGADDLRAAMDFPSTKAYIQAIAERAESYRRRGDFPAQKQTH